jgi:predicted N-formylglutamate amidohydrolase
MARGRPYDLVVSCEHAGNRVPENHAPLFAGRERLLESHRGWDPGAVDYARRLASRAGGQLFYSDVTRLLIDTNRSPTNRRTLFSEFSRALTRRERERVLAEHYRPFREAVELWIRERIGEGRRVLHISCHSFTPVLRGVKRRCDVGWLYDPACAADRHLAGRWIAALAARAPELVLRRNYPYRGVDDGFLPYLRGRLPARDYVSIELEVNQRYPRRGGSRWPRLQDHIVEALLEVAEIRGA